MCTKACATAKCCTSGMRRLTACLSSSRTIRPRMVGSCCLSTQKHAQRARLEACLLQGWRMGGVHTAVTHPDAYCTLRQAAWPAHQDRFAVGAGGGELDRIRNLHYLCLEVDLQQTPVQCMWTDQLSSRALHTPVGMPPVRHSASTLRSTFVISSCCA